MAWTRDERHGPMTRYAALLRGIAPMNPNMRNARLREVAEGLGLQNVATVISSGNLVFDSEVSDRGELEEMIEAGWRTHLGFESTSIVRTSDELDALRELDPFRGREHGPTSYTLVTFAKDRIEPTFAMPHALDVGGHTVVGGTGRELFTISDTTAADTPNIMVWLEREFGKAITSRTWLTVLKILKRCGS
jgi:uncharacterized protein (DUF1697 family)